MNEFKNHELEVLQWSDELLHVKFFKRYPNGRKEIRSEGYMKFILTGGTLVVLGDYGSAIYQWSGKLDISFFESISLPYFKSKCVASEVGIDFVMWDEDECKKNITNFLLKQAGSKYEDKVEDWIDLSESEKLDIVDNYLSKFNTSLSLILCNCSTKREFVSYLDDNCGLFNSDYCGEHGEVTHVRCVLHWKAIQLVANKIKELEKIFKK
jgi:hypothetical protein